MPRSKRNKLIAVNQSRFNLGQVAATPSALETLERHGKSVLVFIERHVNGDWGDW